ncbi:MAG: hypothetical protein U0736_10270 [Gemmataceae bacterium]
MGANSLVRLRRYSFVDEATAFADQGGAINFEAAVTGDQPVTLLGGGGTYRLYAGTAAVPLRIEVASPDRGNTPAGFANPFAVASLMVVGGYTQLTDARCRTNSGIGAEALYAGAVDVWGSATLDLNGLPAYTCSFANHGNGHRRNWRYGSTVDRCRSTPAYPADCGTPARWTTGRSSGGLDRSLP